MSTSNFKSPITIFIIFIVFLLFCFKISFLSDDAFISFRYAKNYINGFGLVYNEGEKVEGYTNFLWVMISSIFIHFNFDPLNGARIASLFFCLLILTLTYLTSTIIFKLHTPISFLSTILVALNPGFVLWAYSGMETIFFTLLITLGIFSTLLYLEKGREKYLIYSSISFTFSALTRPEGVYFFFLNFSYLIILTLMSHKKQKPGYPYKKFLIPILFFVFFYGAYFVWRINYYGYLLPNTFYAKTGFENQILKGIYYCYKFYRDSLSYGLLLIFPIYLFIKSRKDVRLNYMMFILSLYVFYIILIGGDNLLVQRFFVPVIPIIFTLVAAGINKFSLDFSFTKSLRMTIILIIISSSLFIISDNRSFPLYGVSRTLSHYDNLKKAGLWLKENSKPEETVAVESAGIIPFYSELKSYDRLGLNDIYISRMGKHGVGEKEKSDDDYMMWEKKPTYFIDAFPTLYKKDKSDLRKDNIIFKYYSVLIGKGIIEDKPDFPEEGDLYFNFYKREK